MATTNLGRVVPLHKGNYSATTPYELNDIVVYNGSTYWHFTRNVTTGTLPTDTTVWKVVIDLADAEQYIARAETAATNAETAEAGAESAKTAAETAETNAETAQAAAESAKTSAETAEGNAVTAKTAAETAKSDAEGARDIAVQAKVDAVSAKTVAENAKDTAVSSKNAAETAKSAAETAKSDAETAEGNAQTYATNAGVSAGEAAVSAGNALTSEENASTSESNAAASASAASDSEGNAQLSETAAAQSESNSEAWAVGERGGVPVTAGDATFENNAKFYADKAEQAASRTYKKYISKWNKAQHQMSRLGDANDITTTTTHFGHFGSVDAEYSNPFDTLYPWSERRLCNIDMPTYRALTTGDSIRDCVVAWEGDTAFSYTHQYGVWVYTPEFWGDSYDDGTYRYYEVDDRAVLGKRHYPEQMGGRWHGCAVTLTIDGISKTCLLPVLGMPCKNTPMSTIHTYAKNWGATLDNIYSIDASTLLFLVEYASWNTQTKLGQGVSNLYRESSDKIQAAGTGTVVKVLNSVGAAYCIPNAIMDIGISNGGSQVGSYQVISAEVDGDDSTILNVTLDREATVTTDNFWSIHGLCNVADESIGSKSGYIGTNGKSAAYYRGEEFFGNLWRYILGAYHQATTNKLWVAHSAEEADNYDAINTSVHIDTGVLLSDTAGYVKSLGMMRVNGLLAAPVCTEIGGSSDNPVGDYYYVSTGSDTVLILGGSAGVGTYGGRCYGYWRSAAGDSLWRYGGCPLLKTP